MSSSAPSPNADAGLHLSTEGDGTGSLTFATSNRLDYLVERLAQDFSARPLPPLEKEVVVVQSQGMQRWLTLDLARRRGIAASLTTPFPRPFCIDLVNQVLGGAGRPPSADIPRRDKSLFGRELLTWRLFSLLGRIELDEDARFSAPAAYLQDDPDQRKRFQLARRLASLFDDYQLFRPRMLAAWAAGADIAEEPSPTGLLTPDQTPLADAAPSAALWQACLWRRLCAQGEGAIQEGAELENTAAKASDPKLSALPSSQELPLDQQLLELLAILDKADRAPADLPRRVSVLGVSSLPPIFVRLLVGLSRFIPVSVFFLSPTWHYWGDLRSEKESARIFRRMRGGRAGSPLGLDEQLFQTGHPLLAALGRQGRDFFTLLQEADHTGSAWHELDFHEPAPDPEEAKALHLLQSDILHLRDRGEHEMVTVGEGDDSLEIHSCHSALREMEVLHDRLLDAFERDPQLRPAEVLVLVPDIELYGPYIQAVFGVQRPASPHLPFSIADRRAGREQPPSESFLRILEMVSSRLTLREVFDLLDVPAIRRRFALRQEDIPQLRLRMADAGIRWAMDGRQKKRDFDVPENDANTWKAGIDRLLLGYAIGDLGASPAESHTETGPAVPETAFDPAALDPAAFEEPRFEESVETQGLVLGIAPLAGDTAGDADLLGRFFHFIESLFEQLRRLEAPRPAKAWAVDLTAAVDALLLGEGEGEERGLQLVRDTADQLGRRAQRVAVEEPVDLRVVRELLGQRLQEDGFGSGFVNGQITFCALRPMRTIPFRLIAIAGLDDGAFPRQDRRSSFDLMAQHPRPGDRSLRDDDRYLFLETLLAAGERLILSYVGRSQRDRSAKEPSIVLSELLDHLERTFVTPDGEGARQRFVIEHPLQPWNPAYFVADGEGGAGLEAEAASTPGSTGGTGVGATTDRPDPRLYSYSAEDARGARALMATPLPAPPFVETPLPVLEDDADDLEEVQLRADGQTEIALADLLRFWHSPCRWFCQQRLGIELATREEAPEDHEPFGVVGLESYRLRQWMLERRVRPGISDAAAPALGGVPEVTTADSGELALLAARGELPAGATGALVYGRLRQRVETFLERLPSLSPQPPCEIRVEGPGWGLSGWIDGLTNLGLLRFRSARLRPWDRLRAWIEHLALAAPGIPTAPGRGASLPTLIVGEDAALRLPVAGDPILLLQPLIDGFIRGHESPLPFFANTSHSYAERWKAAQNPKKRVRKSPLDVARSEFEGGFFLGPRPPSEADDPWIRLAFRGRDPLEEEDFARWAETIWSPLLDNQEEWNP